LLETIGNINQDFNKDEKKVFETLLETLKNKCNGLIYPKYHLMYRNDRDCEILLFIEPKNNSVFEFGEKKAYNLMILIEVKGHSDFRLTQNNEIIVKYTDGEKNALDQVSISQKKLNSYVKSNLKSNTWIYKFVAFPNIKINENHPQLKNAYENAHINKFLLLFEELTLENILGKCIMQRYAIGNEVSWFTSHVNVNDFKDNFKNFKVLLSGLEKPIELGLFDRKRVENIANNRIKIEEYLRLIDNSNLLITGKAGSGKTIGLIKLAIRLLSSNKKVLILTYNTALATDIYRMVVYYFENFNKNFFQDNDIKKLFKIINIDQLVWDSYDLAKSWINAKMPEGSYNVKYNHIMKSLAEFINQMGKKEARYILDFDYNYIFMDEAQDLDDDAVKALLNLNDNSARIVCIDSPDQSLKNRRPSIIDDKKDFIERTRSVNYRNFKKIQKFSNKINRSLLNKLKGLDSSDYLDDEMESELGDGTVEILQDDKLFENENLLKIINEAEKKGGDKWSILIMQSKSDPDKNKLFEYLKTNNIDFWDGHDDDIRKDFKSFPNKVRIIDYESCRGLEGWTVILRNADIALNYSYLTVAPNEGFIDEQTKRERSKRLLYVASSRAIEKLYITYANEKLLATALKELSKNL